MVNLRVWLVPALGALTLAGCATLSEDECLIGDWRQIGFTDGASGKTADILRNHGKACARFGVGTDYELWRAGYEAGLDVYCTPENAFAEGARGASYDGVCGGDRAFLFNEAYADGRLLHDAITDANYERDRARDLEREIDDLRDKRKDAYARAEDASAPEADRQEALREIRRLNSDIDDAKDRQSRAERRYDRARDEANALRDELLLRYPGVSVSGLPAW